MSTSKEPPRKPNGDRFGDSFLRILTFLRFIQGVVACIDLLTYPLVARILKLRGIDYFVLSYAEISRRSPERFFSLVESLLSDAQEIRIAGGEMGSGLMENPRLLNGLRRAVHNNNALVHIIHGPRVDPDTRMVYELAAEGKLTLFMRPQYDGHHFLLVKGKDDKVTLIDEGMHDEVLWGIDGQGKPKPAFASQVRRFFVTKHTPRLISELMSEFEAKEYASTVDKIHPTLTQTQDLSVLRLLYSAFLCVPTQRLTQWLSLVYDWPIAHIPNKVYKPSTIRNQRLSTTMGTKEAVASRPTINRNIPLNTKIEDIPNNINCVVCGKHADRTYINFELSFDNIKLQALRAAGYRCANDQLEFISDEALLEAYQKAKDIAKAFEDSHLVSAVQERIQIQQNTMNETRGLA
jgi:hypothetical protein